MVRRSGTSGERLVVALAERLLAASAPPDLTAWGELLARSVTLRVGNRSPVAGHVLAMKEVSWLFAGIAHLGDGFRFVRPATDRMTVLMELEAVLRGSAARIPLAIVLRPLAKEGLIADLRIYLDMGPPVAVGASKIRKPNRG